MKSKIPCPPGFMPVIRLAQATGLCGGMLVCKLRKLPRAARAAKFGIFPSPRYCRNNCGSMPSMPRIMSRFLGAGDSSPRVRNQDTARMAPSNAVAPSTSSHLGNRFIFSDAHGEDARDVVYQQVEPNFRRVSLLSNPWSANSITKRPFEALLVSGRGDKAGSWVLYHSHQDDADETPSFEKSQRDDEMGSLSNLRGLCFEWGVKRG